MTTAEAGRKGGEKVLRERGPEFYRAIGAKGGERSWTSRPGSAHAPRISERDRAREREIREKLANGGELTTEEAGFLGGMKRLRQAAGEHA